MTTDGDRPDSQIANRLSKQRDEAAALIDEQGPDGQRTMAIYNVGIALAEAIDAAARKVSDAIRRTSS